MSHNTEQHPVIRDIQSACSMNDIPEQACQELLTHAQDVLMRYSLLDQEAQRRDEVLTFFQQEHADLMAGVHADALWRLAEFLGKHPVSRLPKLSLSTSVIYGILMKENHGDEVAKADALIECLEARGVLPITYIYEEDVDDEDDEPEWAEIEKAYLPDEGVAAHSPITGELDHNFHDKIIRLFSVGKPLLAPAPMSA